MRFWKRAIRQDDRSHRDFARARGPSRERRPELENLEERTLLTPASNARPQGGVVAGGAASITTTPAAVDINQSSQFAIIDWSSFNIGSQQSVIFNQTSDSAITLIRDDSSNASQIAGNVVANGQVFIVDSNGVRFYAGSRVNASGLIATTAGITNGDFMAGNMNFSQRGDTSALIVNDGTITLNYGGELVGLVGPTVENAGEIAARLGDVTLASGHTFTLRLAGANSITAAASSDLTAQRVSNSGEIDADGGTVTLSTAAGGVVDSLVANTGTIQAKSVGTQNGKIILAAASTGGSHATNSGTLTASGAAIGTTGGAVTVTADDVVLESGSMIDVSGKTGGGYVKIGGDFHGRAGTQTALDTTMQSGATINASAITSGDGGRVAVWSDQKTVLDGAITARGGANSGNGGDVETAGHSLTLHGTVDVSAPKGKAGTWLKT